MSERPSPLHEADNVSVRVMATIGLGFLIFVIVASGSVALAFKWLDADSTLVSAEVVVKRQLTGPGVHPNQAEERRQIQASEDALLNQYGWQNQQHDVARIPIDRAIELMAERKLKTGWSKQSEVKP